MSELVNYFSSALMPLFAYIGGDDWQTKTDIVLAFLVSVSAGSIISTSILLSMVKSCFTSFVIHISGGGRS